MMFSSDKRFVRNQVLLWGGVWFVFYLFKFQEMNNIVYLVLRAFMFSMAIMLITNINLKHLVPKLWQKNRYWLYFLIGLVLIVSMSILTDLIIHLWIVFVKNKSRWFDVFEKLPNWEATAPFAITLIWSTLWKVTSRSNEVLHERTQMELRLLKNQLNPHFLFNSLNNIYTLVLLKSDVAPQKLMKLSNILRYVIYDCNEEKVSLKQEIEYIKSYIELVQLKDSKPMNIEFQSAEENSTWQIIPMLLITLVENAVKHSNIEENENAWISIELKTNEKQLSFKVKNSLSENEDTVKTKGGVGLQNIKRQLEVTYPNTHELNTLKTNKMYLAELTIIEK